MNSTTRTFSLPLQQKADWHSIWFIWGQVEKVSLPAWMLVCLAVSMDYQWLHCSLINIIMTAILLHAFPEKIFVRTWYVSPCQSFISIFCNFNDQLLVDDWTSGQGGAVQRTNVSQRAKRAVPCPAYYIPSFQLLKQLLVWPAKSLQNRSNPNRRNRGSTSVFGLDFSIGPWDVVCGRKGFVMLCGVLSAPLL